LAAIPIAIVNSLEDEMRFILFLMFLATAEQGSGTDADGRHLTTNAGVIIDPNG